MNFPSRRHLVTSGDILGVASTGAKRTKGFEWMEARDAGKTCCNAHGSPHDKRTALLKMSVLPQPRKPYIKEELLQIYGPTALPQAGSLEEFLLLCILPVFSITRLLNF